MLAAQHLVVDGGVVGVSYDDLLSGSGDVAVDDAGVELSFGSAPAQHFDLEAEGLVGEFEEALGGGEQDAAEVGGQAEGVDVDAVAVDEVGHLLDVADGVELDFVADDVVGVVGVGQGADVVVVGEFGGVFGQADACGDARGAGAVVAGEEESLSA